MKVVGLITEYNPFHNGHKYHLEEAKRVTGADYVIVVMSGNFVQRGTPAMMDKYSRTRMALNNGADLVLEIPVCYATGSAEYFAHGAISLLDKLGIVDYVCFGSECGDISLINELAELLLTHNQAIEETLLSYVKEGFTYPAARSRAMALYLSSHHQDEHHASLSEFLTKPNNILGIEYVKALKQLSSSIKPITIQRQAANYHDSSLSDLPVNSTLSPNFEKLNQTLTSWDNVVISSATAIRKAILNSTEQNLLSTVEYSVPKDVYDFILCNYHKTYPITEEDFSHIIKYKLLSEDTTALTRYIDITNDLAGRMKNLTDLNIKISDLSQRIKTKNITLTRANRALIHLLLNLYQNSLEQYNNSGYVSYARVLGIKKASSPLLRHITKKEGIPLITKVSKAKEQLNAIGMQMLSEDIFASHLYNQAVYEKYNTIIENEYIHGIVII